MLVDDLTLEAIYQLQSRLEAAWLPPMPSTETYHAYDPLPIAIFLDGLATVNQYAKGKRFMDVGCGMGTKLAFMHYMGWQVYGVERFGPYADVAHRFVPEASIAVYDAFDIADFDADVVYSYRCCRTDETEFALESHIAENLSPGTVLWLPVRLGTLPDLPLRRVTDEVWVA